MTFRLDGQIRMSQRAVPGREDVVTMLAAFGDRKIDEVAEQIDSLELTWLITSIEERYEVTLDLDDEEFAQMRTITGVLAVFREALAGAGHG
jgi:acyl carrier protein